MRIEMELRNLKLFRLLEYLAEAGGEITGERSAQGQPKHQASPAESPRL